MENKKMQTFLFALIGFFVLVFIFQYTWNTGAVKAVSIFKRIDYLAALCAIIVLMLIASMMVTPKINVGELNLTVEDKKLHMK